MRISWFALALLVLSACGFVATPPTPATPPTAPVSTPDPRVDAILATMNAYERVIRDGYQEPVAAITDSAPIRRFLTSAADVAPPSEGAAHRTYTVATLREPLAGIVEAELVRDDGKRLRMLFRQHGATWVLTEPTADELGARTTIMRGRLRIESFAGYPYTDAVADAIAGAYTRVERFFGAMPDQQLRVVLKPVFGIGPILPFDVQAYYEGGGHPQLVVTAPWSMGFRPYDPALGWEGVVTQLAAHELTHFVHTTDPALMSVNKVPTWVAEGLAEYVAAPLRLDQARTITARGGWLPLTSGKGPSLLNIEALTPQERTTAYIQAQLLIAYLARDDHQQLWAFIDAYAAAPGGGTDRLEAALQHDLHTNLDQFLDDWQQWVDHQITAGEAP
jgi:hypothetical protein